MSSSRKDNAENTGRGGSWPALEKEKAMQPSTSVVPVGVQDRFDDITLLKAREVNGTSSRDLNLANLQIWR